MGLMLTVNEAAKRMNVSAEHIRRMCRAGVLKSYDVSIKDGRATYRIDANELEQYMTRRAVVKNASDEKVRAWRGRKSGKNS